MEFDKLVSSFGWPGAILVVSTIFGWRILSYVGKELFDRSLDDTRTPRGLFVRVVEEHRLFLRSAIANIDATKQHLQHEEICLKSMAESSEKTAQVVESIGNGLDKINDAQQHLAAGQRTLAETWHCRFQTGGT